MIRRRNPRFYKGEFFDILKFLISQKEKSDYIKIFEEEFADYIGVKHALTICTGRSSLELILEALNLKEGEQVIFPAFTLKELIILVKRNKLEPVLVDIESDSFNINSDLIEEKITNKTKVIIATHLFGLPCNIEKIIKIAIKYDLKVIEDCAHACGAEYNGKKCGSLGTAGFFSLELTKAMNTFGGGVVTTDDDNIASFIRERIEGCPRGEKKLIKKLIFSYAEYFLIKSPIFLFFSFMFCFMPSARIVHYVYSFFNRKFIVEKTRFTNLQAYLGLKQLREIEERNRMRFEKAEMLNKLLESAVCLQVSGNVIKRVYYFFVIKIPDSFNVEYIRRNSFFRGIDAGIKDEITDDCSIFIGGNYSVTKCVYNSLILLPMYDSISTSEIRKIAKVINNILE
ncbi:MAG: DegT/DnrJ/EryC1/StrS family aminotransferase [Candidatus Omnitrophica bacterium]|nr:DegT/DnrJ/EryC1/StrS family aminotransferase [Candidatus Omnitrophota bacterium]